MFITIHNASTFWKTFSFHISSHSLNLLIIEPFFFISFQPTLAQRRQRLNSFSAAACIATITICRLERLIIVAKMARWSLGSLRKGEVMRFLRENWIFVDEKKMFLETLLQTYYWIISWIAFSLATLLDFETKFSSIERTPNASTILQRHFDVHSGLCIWNRKARSSRESHKNVV